MYLSALPFAPIESKVSEKYLPNYPNTLEIQIGKVNQWPAIHLVIEGHEPIDSVAFSPDGKQIVSGSYDKTIRVRDAQTGNIISGPSEGHTDCVNSVAFSPNGKQIVSGSADKTIHVWDAQTGNIVSGPFKGHTNHVTSVMFLPKSDYPVVLFHFYSTDMPSISHVSGQLSYGGWLDSCSRWSIAILGTSLSPAKPLETK